MDTMLIFRPCSSPTLLKSLSSYNDIEYFGDKRLIRVCDILGRKVNPDFNVPLFFIYDDGTVEKKIMIRQSE